MFKKAFESFFIIDANEKPAPSFLAAYLFTWLVFHNQTITTFIATDADFFTRLNMAIGAVGDNRYGAVFIITCVLVFGRFSLNNSLYICREWLDNKTQGWLTKNGYKSFTSDKIHQKALDDLASTRAELHAFHDRAIAAEEVENNIKMEFKKFKNDTETQNKDNQHIIEAQKIEIDKKIKLSDVLNNDKVTLKEQLVTSSEEYQKISSAFDQLQGLHTTLTGKNTKLNFDYNKLAEEKIRLNQTINNLNEELKGLTKSYDDSQKNIFDLSKDYEGSKVQIKIMDQSMIKLLAQNEELASDLSSSDNLNDIIHKRITKWAKYIEKQELMLLERNESNLTNYENVLLDKLLKSEVVEEKPLNKAQALIEKVKLYEHDKSKTISTAQGVIENVKRYERDKSKTISTAQGVIENVKRSERDRSKTISTAQGVIENVKRSERDRSKTISTADKLDYQLGKITSKSKDDE